MTIHGPLKQAGNPIHDHAPWQIFQPDPVVPTSEDQDIDVVVSTLTPAGPELPSYVDEPMVSLSYSDSVENAVTSSAAAKLARMLHAWLVP